MAGHNLEFKDSKATLEPPNDRGIQSVERTFQILEVMADAGGRLSLTEVVRSSDLPKTTVHRTIRTLLALGYVRQEDTKIYSLGPRLILLGRVASLLLGSWARPFLARIVAQTEETASLAVLDQDEVVFIGEVPSKRFLKPLTEQGRRVPAHSTASGKALLAQLSDERIREIADTMGLQAITPKTITDIDALLTEIDRTRAAGYATDIGEHEQGMRSIAVPVLDGPRNMAVAVSGPDARLRSSEFEAIATSMQSIAADLSRHLDERG